MGHKDVTTTHRSYDEWVPKEGQTFADILEPQILAFTAAPVPPIPEPETRTKLDGAPDWDSELAELTGENSGAGGGS